MAVLVGISGWSHPTGRGTWNGLFYPARRPARFDELAYYAEYLDTVEVNSTFYRVPSPARIASWLRRTPASFLFSVKLYQKFTHPDMFLARRGVADWNVTRGDLDEFKTGLEPIADSGRLAALLMQFPPSFHAGPEARDYVDWLASSLGEYPLAVELRHRSWSDDAAETLRRLAVHRATWVHIDEPRFSTSVRHDFSPDPTASDAGTEAPLVYMRFHGRNAAQWWRHAEAEGRYDYLYGPEDLVPFAEAATRASDAGRRVVMYLNNHFSAKAVANAAVLKHQLGQPVPGVYPRAIVEQYPDLAGIVATSSLLL